jgi:general secretion pathway protein G
MRETIDTYTFDEEKPPFRLQDLVDAGYLRHIPVDPITQTTDWRIHFADVKISSTVVIKGVDDVIF